MYPQLYMLRRERRIYQKDLAKVLRISQASYQNKEIGRTSFTLPEAILLSNFFCVSLDILFKEGGSN